MPRISTSQANLASLQNFLNGQSDLVKSQAQVSSGKKATDLKGLVKELGTLNAARSVIARSKGAVDRIAELEPKLAIQDAAFEQLSGAGDAIRQNLIGSLGLNDGLLIINGLQSALDQVSNALNQKFAGNSIFGGSKVDTKPFTANSLADLAAAAQVSDLFQNSDVKPVSRIDDGVVIETGFLADDVATDVVSIIKAIKDFNDGANGPFTASLTAAQRTFIESQLAAIAPALDALNQVQGENGLLQARVEATKIQEEERQVLLTGVIGDLEDVDMAEAVSRLQQVQTAVEASARTFNILSSTSLLNFLR
ncbi:Flagellar hook-associated protein FlgL [hydrothermal vent metagenome]|uniref:Flagellar hook-associated protein FlgL n=1 Tax=hydrothermal vent metagenome TaxID=652676 RepID=A0A3B0R621_9ZZZZ